MSEASIDQRVEAAKRQLHAFREAALIRVDVDVLNQSEPKVLASVFMYGAADAVCQHYQLSEGATAGVALCLLHDFGLSHKSAATLIAELGDLVSEEQAAHDALIEGGQSVLTWLAGDALAPMKLASLVKVWGNSKNTQSTRPRAHGVKALPRHITLDSIIQSTNRLAITNAEGQALLVYLKTAAKNGLDICLHPMMAEAGKEAFDDGVLVLSSVDLDADFVFVKIDGGRGLFGRQKSNVLSYVGHVSSDELMPGTSFRGLAIALTSINNIYREVGLLRGPAL
ncbi:MAG: hypothetical protein GC159_04070 [Phycisphaera sp.]|nr:hypothetical protein [Phycisphaera sp.]